MTDIGLRVSVFVISRGACCCKGQEAIETDSLHFNSDDSRAGATDNTLINDLLTNDEDIMYYLLKV